ncbi:hypothetical protein [Megamonas funiformis]|uniref:hypothetical protein n=1 Tax=Megamonas funiformis TaxID=437897 RepID=UPI0022E4B572|nr:hypothetical protein [Megamonas funiformis]
MNNELLLNALKTAYNNENIRLKLNSAKNYDELALILQQENIIQCTAKDLSDLMSNMKNNELSDYQLDNIVGGIAGIDDFITWLMKKTKQFIQSL